MKDNRYTIAPTNTNTAGFATAVTGDTFTLTATSSGDSLAHKVTVLNNSATDHSGKTLAIVGYDVDGRDQTETLTAPAASVSVTSAKYWGSLTSITPSATIGADTFNIGWANTFSTKTLPINWRGGAAALSLDVTGTINYDLQQTFDDIQTKTTAFAWMVNDTATQAGVTADLVVRYEAHPKAIRILVNSFTDGATIYMGYTQRDS